MFFKRLFQCVRYSVSLYADCAVIYQGSRKSRGRLGDRSPPPPDFGRCTNVIRITGLITPTSLLLVLPPPPDFQTYLWPCVCVAESCKVTLTSNMILASKKMQLYRILQGLFCCQNMFLKFLRIFWVLSFYISIINWNRNVVCTFVYHFKTTILETTVWNATLINRWTV